MRNKNKAIQKLKDERKEAKDAQIAKRDKKKNQVADPEEHSEDEDEDLDVIYEKIESDAQVLIADRAESIKKKSVKMLREQLEKNLDSIKEKPLEILKRLESYQKASSGESHAQGKSFNNTVLVKVFVKSFNREQDSDAEDDDFKEFDDGMSVRSKVSHKSAVSAKTGKSIKSRKIRDREEKERQKQEAEENRTSHDEIFRFYQETFKISKKTLINEFKKTITTYWGLEEKDFFFYDDNGDIIDNIGDTGINHS